MFHRAKRIAPRSSTPVKPVLLRVVVLVLVLAIVRYWAILFKTTPFELKDEVSQEERLREMIHVLRDNDLRLVRPGVRSNTSYAQENGGCDHLSEVLNIICDKTSSDLIRGLAAQVGTLCTTDNPTHRRQVGDYAGIHEALVQMLSLEKTPAASAAAEFIWIASFNSETNHEGFLKAGAMQVLGKLIVSRDSTPPLLSMWASVAVQNLAASYCDTDWGGCSWGWNNDYSKLIVRKKSRPVTIDGTEARRQMFDLRGIIPALLSLTCTGPVSEPQSVENPWPGDLAQVDRDENSHNLVAWGAAGALKNLALLPEARPLLLESTLPCLCRLSDSPDWLERNKAGTALFHLRHDYPCFWNEDGELCVNRPFLDKDGYACDAYKSKHCKEYEKELGQDGHSTVKDACCTCGGGDWQAARGPEKVL